MANKKERKKVNIDFLKNDIGLVKIVCIVCIVLFALLFIRYQKNKWFYKYFNSGVSYYIIEEYDLAESYFTDALYEKPKGKNDCKTRINLALSMVKPITPESVTKENYQECIDKLTDARNLLVENGCASDSGSDGHNKYAQTLKEEIDEYIEQLKNSESSEPEDGNENKDDNKSDGQSQQTTEEKVEEIDQQFEEIRQMMEADEKQGQEERYRKNELFDNWGQFDSYSDKKW